MTEARTLPDGETSALLRELLAEVRAGREERARLLRELDRLRAVTDELMRRRAKRADVPPPTGAPPDVRSRVYGAMARAERRRREG